MKQAGPRVQNGIDRLVADGFEPLRGRRVGVIANQTSVDQRLRHLADLIQQAPEVDLVALFGPEHGIRGDAQDLIGVASSVDRRTGVPVHSLYGDSFESLKPRLEHLEGLDGLIFDIQDVGSRYYTYAATMLYAMEAAAEAGVSFVVLDRPNPIGGERVEGPTVQPGFESFISAYPLPVRHGLTIGELARLFQVEKRLDLDLEVIPCQGWDRGMLWQDTGLPWVYPSPNMPTAETALVYPGGCVLEGTNLSEGRGTTRPFELWGAPWLEGWGDAIPEILADEPGVLFRPCAFRPVFHKYVDQLCFGVQPHVTDPTSFSPLRLYTRLLGLARAFDPERFGWRTEPYEFVADPIAIDLLFGSDRERGLIESVDPEVYRTLDRWSEAFAEPWERDESEFRERRAPILLYRSEGLDVSVAVPERAAEVILRVEGMVAKPLALTFADLTALPETDQVRDVSRFRPGRKGNGVTLEAVLRRAGPDAEADTLTLQSSLDDFHISVPLDAIRAEGLIVYQHAGQPLPVESGGPVRFLVRDPAASGSSEIDKCANVKFLDCIKLSQA